MTNEYSLKVNQAKEHINQMVSRKVLEVNDLISRQYLSNNMAHGMGLDAKRSKAWCEYGYPDEVTFEMALMAYRRGGIATSAINKTIGRTWINNPEIKETDDSDEQSDWELKVESVLTTDFYSQFKEADKRRMIGQYSGLLLRFNDYPKKNEWINKPKTGVTLNRVEPVWQSSLTPNYEGNRIVSWQVTLFNAVGASADVLTVHPSRIFILGDITPDGASSLEAGFNNLINIEKILGGGGESFAKNAARQLLVNFASDIDLSNVAESFGIEEKDLEEHFSNVVRDINTGNDTMMITQGANVQPLTTTVPDPMNHYEINLAIFASTYGMPQTELLGNNEGERASTENGKQWSLTIEERRDIDITSDLTRFINQLMDLGSIPARAKFNVVWQRLVSATATEKMEIADKMASVVLKWTQATGRNDILTVNEIREAMDLLPIEVQEEVLPDYDATIPAQF